MKKLIAIFLLLFFYSAAANSETFSGNKLLEMIQSKEWANKYGGLQYILGVLEAKVMQAYKDNLRTAKDVKLDEPAFCIPENVTNRQVLDIVENFLINNPADRHEQALPLVQIALGDAFNCK